MNRTMVIAISILLAFCAGIYFWTEWQKKEFDASLPEPPAPVQVQAAETNDGHTGGHWHGDEWHAEPHNSVFTTPIVDEDEVDFSVQPIAASAVAAEQLPAELADILATPEYAERLRVIRSIARYSPEYGQWAEEDLRIKAEGELLDREYPLWAPNGTASREEIEKRVLEQNQRIANMTREERLALAEKLEAHQQKYNDWAERRKAHEAKMPPAMPSQEYRYQGTEGEQQ